MNVNVANNQGFGDKQKTMFIRVALFGKRAEGQLKDYLVKGQQVFVSGELSVNEYQAQDGTTKTNLELNANIIDLVGKKSGTEQKQENHAQYSEQNSRKYQTQNVEEFDDIPF